MTDQPAAGPALDAEIARRVFGYEVDYSPDWGCDYTQPPGWPDRYQGPERPAKLQPYSSDMRAAWTVVERFLIKDDSWRFQLDNDEDAAQIWHARFSRAVFGWWDYETAEAVTPMLAICRAALKAVQHAGATEQGGGA